MLAMLLMGGLYGRILGRIFVDLFGVQVRTLFKIFSVLLSLSYRGKSVADAADWRAVRTYPRQDLCRPLRGAGEDSLHDILCFIISLTEVRVLPMLLIGGLYGRILGRIFVDLFRVQVRTLFMIFSFLLTLPQW